MEKHLPNCIRANPSEVLHEDFDVVEGDVPTRVCAHSDVERAHCLARSERHDVRALRRDLLRRAHNLLVEGYGTVMRCGIVAREDVNL